LTNPLSLVSVDTLKGVGPKIAEKLATLGLCSLEDLLFHLPNKYQDRSRIHPISSLLHGQTALIFGQIESANIQFGKRRSLVCKIADDTDLIEIRLFYFSAAQKNQFVVGDFIQCYGQVSKMGRSTSMIHPEITFLRDKEEPKLEQRLHPIYATCDGLQQRTFFSLIEQTLKKLVPNSLNELLPRNLLERLSYPCLTDAIRMLHRPPLDVSLEAIQKGEHPLIQRLAFEELMAQHLAMTQIKSRYLRRSSYPIQTNSKHHQRFLANLPFELTAAQQRVSEEIRTDIEKIHPMMRLVQGDVGCGKTLVAAIPMLQVALNGYQSVMMAPTEILAEQHFLTFKKWFDPLGIKVSLLTSKMTSAQRKSSLQEIADGSAQIVLGTHAVFQAKVTFSTLSFVVIDEQHRFGVEQRKTLLDKSSTVTGKHPHQLIMTATPIPRTLSQTVYADLDLSVIDELPPGRMPIETTIINDSKRDNVIYKVKQSIQNDHRQVYWVCTLIDESEELECQAAELVYQNLSDALAPFSVGLVHGRLSSSEKQTVMNRFKSGELDLLVATTVIEVGVDVANASLMVIENPERLGLSQLHQLRGRVGRGELQSYCLLMYHSPLSKNAKQRLEVMRETTDGFKIAEKDLEIRGAGEVLGTRQTGDTLFRFADLLRDRHLLVKVQQNAKIIADSHPALAKQLIERWVKKGQELVRV
jgi:ATP-dependent DNA helicase RecG